MDSPEKLNKSSPSSDPDVNILNDVNHKLSINCGEEVTAHDPIADLQELTQRLTAKCPNFGNQNTSDQIHSVSPNLSPNFSCCSDISSPDQPQTTESRNDISPDEISSGGSKMNPPSPPMQELPSVIALGWEEPVKPAQEIYGPAPPPIHSVNSINEEDNRSSYLSPLRDTSTFAARYQCDDGECSVQSCLNQFTSVELMTGSNKVCCEACTKKSKDGKSVYTNSTKQLLIASPPAVLILHLKRFQVFRSLFRKMSKTVTFPLILDLAPFCSNSCKPNNQQNKVLYSLYGVVEHSGTLHGGHYVAYVKVRPKIDESDPRWRFLPPIGSKTQNSSHTHIIDESDENSEPTAPPGKWYYVSDSQVSVATESRVLRAQAYLLFYERIL